MTGPRLFSMAYITFERKNLICDACDDLTPHIVDYLKSERHCTRCTPFEFCHACNDYSTFYRGDASQGKSSELECRTCATIWNPSALPFPEYQYD